MIGLCFSVRQYQLEWISAAEGIRFAETMPRMEQICRSVTAEEIAETRTSSASFD